MITSEELKKLYLGIPKLSQREIGKQLNVSQSTIKYYLKKYKITRNENNILKPDPNRIKLCPSCKEEKSGKEFYWQSGNKPGQGSWCKFCMKQQVLNRQRKYKQEAIDSKGGKCEICGYNNYNGALEFHHLDPSKKDLNISLITKSINKFNKFKQELDKCKLLCSNCHREEHARLKGII